MNVRSWLLSFAVVGSTSLVACSVSQNLGGPGGGGQTSIGGGGSGTGGSNGGGGVGGTSNTSGGGGTDATGGGGSSSASGIGSGGGPEGSEWVAAWTGTGWNRATRALAVDNDHAVIVSGTIGAPTQVGNTFYPVDDGTVMAIVAKYDVDGNLAWSHTFGGMTATADGVVVDPQGNVIVEGNFSDTLDIGAGPSLSSTNGPHPYLAVFSKDGKPVAQRDLGVASGMTTPENVGYASLAVNSSGSIVAAITYQGSIDPGNGLVDSYDPDDENFLIAYYDSSLNLISATGNLGGAAQSSGGGEIFLMDDGSIWLNGAFDGTFDLGGGYALTSQDVAGYIARLDPSGAPTVLRALPSTQMGLLVTPSGKLFLSGEYSGALHLDGITLPSHGFNESNFLATLDASAHATAARNVLATFNDFPFIVADHHDNILLFSGILGLAKVQSQPFGHAGRESAFYAITDPELNLLSGDAYFNPAVHDASTHVLAGDLDASGHIVISGYLGASLDFGVGVVPAPPASGDLTVFIARLKPQ